MQPAHRETLNDPLLGLVSDPVVQIPQWKRVLYYIQLQAPKPRKVECLTPVPSRPPYYGSEFHGMITRHRADELLGDQDGTYLVRESMRTPGSYTLAIRFQGTTKNYRLFYSNGQHHVGDKCFESLGDLVADGLICFYVHVKAPEYIASMSDESHYAESPYMRYREQAMRISRQAMTSSSGGGSSRRQSSSAVPPPPPTPVGSSPAVQRASSFNANGFSPVMQQRLDHPDSSLQPPSSARSIGDWMDIMQSEKPHNFKLTTFKGISSCWCEFCLHFMWGLIQQGVECQDCGFRAHKKCSEKVPNDCMPCMRKLKRMFSLDLTTLLKATSKSIPVVVEKCVYEIELRGMEEEGLYRAAGSHDDIEAIRSSFDIDGDADISAASYKDINTVTSVLKLFFRLLPLPLITDEVYPKCIALVTAPEEIPLPLKLRKLKDALAGLPPAHYQTLKYLMAHLNRVTQYKRNMMSSTNLAMVFAPTLLQSPQQTDPMQGMTVVRQEQLVVDLLIINYEVIFER